MDTADPTSIRALLVEDDEDDFLITRDMLTLTGQSEYEIDLEATALGVTD